MSGADLFRAMQAGSATSRCLPLSRMLAVSPGPPEHADLPVC